MRISFFIFAILALLAPQIASAALPAGTVWEVEHAGLNTNGGGFVAGVCTKASATDLVVSSGSNVQVSSATYGFTSADVGRWLSITSGTGWTVGGAQILYVTSGVATLSRSPAAVSATGGSFTVYYGIDYSQKNAKNTTGNNISTTDLVTAGTTTLVSATAAFTNDICGNIIYVSGGTGSIAGAWYEATGYTNATTITVDRSTGLTTGTGATLNIGGALGDLATLTSVMVQANSAWVKNDATYQTAANITFATSYTRVQSYGSVRGDGGSATIQAITTSGLTVLNSGNNGSQYFANFTIDCNSLPTCTGVGGSFYWSDFHNITVKNYSLYGIFVNNSTVEFSNIYGGTSTSAVGIYMNGTNSTGAASNNYVHDGIGIGIEANYFAPLTYNIVANMSGTSSDCIQQNANTGFVADNIAFNCGRDGIRTGLNEAVYIKNNILDSNGEYGINGTSNVVASSQWDGNAYYNNALGNRHNMDDLTISSSVSSGVNHYVNAFDVILTADPFVNAAGNDFNLNNTSGGGALLRGTGVPQSWPNLSGVAAHPDFGAVQHQCSGGGGVSVCAQ